MRPSPMLARATLVLLLFPTVAMAQVTVDLPVSLPAAVVDLRTAEGAALVGARWRYSDVKVIEIDHHAVGPDLRASGAPNRTGDISPHAEPADFDDSAWEAIEPEALEARRSNGRLAFNWYRTKITLPRTIGGLDVTGSTVVFELVVDDYAEIWVDGRLPLVLGQTGGPGQLDHHAAGRDLAQRSAKGGHGALQHKAVPHAGRVALVFGLEVRLFHAPLSD